MEENDRLFRIAGEACSEHGLKIKSARYEDYKDLKVTWSSRGNERSYGVTDYVSDSPDHILFDFLDSMVLQSMGRKKKFCREYMDWVSSDSFILSKRPIYLTRCRNVSLSASGDHHDLGDSLDRLLDMGLLHDTDIDNSFFTWTLRPGYTKVGSCNPVFRVVTISSSLDSPDVPRNVLDFVTYHETLHLRRGYVPGRRAHDSDFRRSERDFPGWQECEKHLVKMKAKQKARK